MVLFTTDLEEKLDTAFAQWLLSTRRPSETDLAKTYTAAVALVEQGFCISPSLAERSYRSLLAAGEVAVALEPLQVEATPIRSKLTADEYNRMSIASIRQRFAQDADFRTDVDALLKSGRI